MWTDFFLWENLLLRLIALTVILLVLIFRRLLARAVIHVLFARLRSRNPERYAHVRAAWIRPLSWMLLAGTVRASLPFVSIPEPYAATVANVLSTLFLMSAFWAFYVAAGLTAGMLLDTSRESGKKVDVNAANYLAIALKVTVVIIGLFAVLSRWVSDISGLIAGLGIGGLAIALAAQDTASNVFGSIAIMIDKPFEIGDWIEVDNLMGTVVSVGLRSSQIRVLDQSIVSIPNTKLASSVISNGTRRMRRRVSFKVSLACTTEPEEITAFVENVRTLLMDDPGVEHEGILVSFDSITPAAFEIFVAFQTYADYSAMLAVKHRSNLAILRLVREMGITLAYPLVSLIKGTE